MNSFSRVKLFPPIKKLFSQQSLTLMHLQQVRLNGIEYSSPHGANNKKEAKSAAAKFCLQQLGVLPT